MPFLSSRSILATYGIRFCPQILRSMMKSSRHSNWLLIALSILRINLFIVLVHSSDAAASFGLSVENYRGCFHVFKQKSYRTKMKRSPSSDSFSISKYEKGRSYALLACLLERSEHRHICQSPFVIILCFSHYCRKPRIQYWLFYTFMVEKASIWKPFLGRGGVAGCTPEF